MTSTLNLTIVNDSNSYSERKSIAYRNLGLPLSVHAFELRDIVKAAAQQERQQFGSKFTPADLKDAALLVAEHDRAEQLDDLRRVSVVTITGRRWFQRTYGNTYHSVTILFGAGKRVHLPKEYGYGSQWEQTGKDWLKANGFLCRVDVGSGVDVARERDL